MLAASFEYEGLYYYILSDEDKTCEVSDCSTRLTSAVIPPTVTYNGTTYSVTSIGDWAFYECSHLTSIEIPNSVTSIGSSAFYNCSGLTTIEIPNFVTSIGNSAFYGCSGLATVEIPNSVTSIGYEAFYGCERLHSVTIGAGVLSIGSNAFVYRDGTLIIDRPEKVIWLCNTPPEGHDNAEGSVNYVANTSYNGL